MGEWVSVEMDNGTVESDICVDDIKYDNAILSGTLVVSSGNAPR